MIHRPAYSPLHLGEYFLDVFPVAQNKKDYEIATRLPNVFIRTNYSNPGRFYLNNVLDTRKYKKKVREFSCVYNIYTREYNRRCQQVVYGTSVGVSTYFNPKLFPKTYAASLKTFLSRAKLTFHLNSPRSIIYVFSPPRSNQ